MFIKAVQKKHDDPQFPQLPSASFDGRGACRGKRRGSPSTESSRWPSVGTTGQQSRRLSKMFGHHGGATAGDGRWIHWL